MDLKQLLKDQKAELQEEMEKKNLVEREAQQGFKNFASSKLIKVISGIRRSGKSVFTYMQLKDKEFGYVNFDDERLVGVETDKIFSSFLEIYKDLKLIFFDEIQNTQNWELFANRLQRNGYNLFITGSNANLLSKELAAHLTGRHLALEIFPLSFREYLKSISFKKNLDTTQGQSFIKRELEDYLCNGGFPEIVIDKENPRLYLRELYRKIIEKDVILRYNLAYKKTLKEISLSIISNPSQLITYNRLKKLFNLGSEHTAKNYVSYLEEAYLIFQISKFSFKPSEIERSAKKVYVIDSGLMNYLGTQATKNLGAFFENAAALELIRKKSSDEFSEIYYWRDFTQQEVDFVIKRDLKITQLIQVCYDLDDEQTKKREIRSLLKASQELKCNNLLVITNDYEVLEKHQGKTIKFLPLWKWLLQ